MPPQGLLLIAAYMPEEWPVASSTRISRRRLRRSLYGPTSSLPAACIFRRSRCTTLPAAPRLRESHSAGRSMVSTRRKCTRITTTSISARSATAPTGSSPASMTVACRRRRNCASKQEHAALNSDFGLSSGSLARYLMCTLRFFQWLPVFPPILRHPQPLWSSTAVQDRGAISAKLDAICAQTDHPPSVYLSTTISSAIAKPRATCCRIWSRGRKSAAIRCSLPARRRSISPSRTKSSR